MCPEDSLQTSGNDQLRLKTSDMSKSSQNGQPEEENQTLMDIRLLGSDIMHPKETNSYDSIKIIKPSELPEKGLYK